MSILRVQNLKKTYARGETVVHALAGVDLELKQGDFACIMGASGSGKSTLLHLAGALDRPTSGQVFLEDKKIDEMSDQDLSCFRRRRLGFIFQFFNLVPTMTALENVALPLLLDGEPLAKIAPRAMELLDLMGLKSRADHRPHQLSGGEMQRVAIARALVSKPALILADEPTGNLDSKTGASVLQLLQDLAKVHQQTILMVTHDPVAAKYGNRAIQMKDGLILSDERLG